MSCYFRHLKDLFTEAGIEVTPANKKQIDRVFHQVVNTEYKNCPDAWRKIKQELRDDTRRAELVGKLKAAFQNSGI